MASSERDADDDEDDSPPASPTSPPRSTIEIVADKGYHKVELLLDLRRAGYRTYIPAPKQSGQRRSSDKGGMLAREAFRDNRKRVNRPKGKKLLRLRGERIERTFALACETGAHRRVRLRGRENVRKRYLAHTAALNLGLVRRTLFGYGTPRQAAQAALAALLRRLAMLVDRLARIEASLGAFIGIVRPASGTLLLPLAGHASIDVMAA